MQICTRTARLDSTDACSLKHHRSALDQREGVGVVQLARRQVAQVSQRCKLHVRVGGDKQVYADLQPHRKQHL